MNTLRAALGGFLLLINSAGVLATEPERLTPRGGEVREEASTALVQRGDRLDDLRLVLDD